jgi:hypothetical protein
VVVAVFMATFVAALLVLMGFGVGVAVSNVVTLPMRHVLGNRASPNS